MSATCLVCRDVSGEAELPGGLLLDEEHVVAFHGVAQGDVEDVYLGWLLVASRRHAPGFEDLRDDEAAAVGVGVSRLATVLRDVAGADHVVVTRIGMGQPHLHIHLLPRYPRTPRDRPWHRVDGWDGARRGDFADAAEFAASLRERPEHGATLAGL